MFTKTRRAKAPPLKRDELLYSNRSLVNIIVPLLLTQLLSILVSTVDTVMVSFAGEAAVSGVSLVASLDTLLMMFFTSMIAGGAVVLTQTLGRGSYADVYEVAKQLLYICTLIATVLAVVVSVFSKPLLYGLFGEAEDAIMQSAKSYFFFIALSYPFVAIQDAAGACFRASGDTRTHFFVSLAVNMVNVCFNAFFIYKMGMGAAGAALATLIARGCGAVILFVLILGKKHEIHIERILHYRPNFIIIKQIMGIGVPNGIENAMFQFGRVVTQSLISSLGTTAIAANAIAFNICNFQYLVGSAFATTIVTVVGFCLGSREQRQAKYYARRLIGFEYAVLWVVIGLSCICINPLLSLYNLSGASAALAKQLVFYHAVFAAAIWPIGFTLPSAFRAAGDVRYPMVVSMATMWIFRVVGAYFCALESVSVFGLFTVPGLGLGIAGVWFAMTVDWLIRAVLFFIHFIKGKWALRRSVAVEGAVN